MLFSKRGWRWLWPAGSSLLLVVWREVWVLLENAGWKRLFVCASQEALASKVKQQWIVVVELIKHCTFFLRHQPVPEKRREDKNTWNRLILQGNLECRSFVVPIFFWSSVIIYITGNKMIPAVKLTWLTAMCIHVPCKSNDSEFKMHSPTSRFVVSGALSPPKDLKQTLTYWHWLPKGTDTNHMLNACWLSGFVHSGLTYICL